MIELPKGHKLDEVTEAHTSAKTEHISKGDYTAEEWEQLKKDTWIATYTARKFHAWTPSVDEISIQDIAHHLATINRYNGAARFPLSVAQHSLMVMERVADPALKLTALLHDASEAYIMDVPRPWKPFIHGYKELEDIVMKTISEKFGLVWPLPQQVKVVDRKMLYTEASQLLPGADWIQYQEAYNGMPIKEMHWREVEAIFLQVFAGLYK